MKYYLVTYTDNWADEIDVSGHMIMSDKDYKEFCKAAKEVFKSDGEFTYYVGTNQDITYYSYADFMETMHKRVITEAEIKVLEKFEICDSGNFPYNEIQETFESIESGEDFQNNDNNF
jgi:hypothetical protein